MFESESNWVFMTIETSSIFLADFICCSSNSKVFAIVSFLPLQVTNGISELNHHNPKRETQNRGRVPVPMPNQLSGLYLLATSVNFNNDISKKKQIVETVCILFGVLYFTIKKKTEDGVYQNDDS